MTRDPSAREQRKAEKMAEKEARRAARAARAATSVGPFRYLRNSFFTGVVVVAPVGMTAWLVYAFITFVDAQVKPLIPDRYNPETYLPFAIPGLGLVVAIGFVTLLGAMTANFLGRAIVNFGERLVHTVPLVRNIYGALKQVIGTIIASRETAFKQVALVEYPRKGAYALGFVTAPAQGELQRRAGDGWVGVFIPTTPNPTSGFLLYYHESELTILDMSVEEGAKLIISAGLVSPDDLPGAGKGPSALATATDAAADRRKLHAADSSSSMNGPTATDGGDSGRGAAE